MWSGSGHNTLQFEEHRLPARITAALPVESSGILEEEAMVTSDPLPAVFVAVLPAGLPGTSEGAAMAIMS